MRFRRVRNEEAELGRFVDECWFPYQAELSETIPAHALVDDVDREQVVDHHVERLDSPSARLWAAVDGAADPGASLATIESTVAGFVRTSVSPSPQRFDWPVRLVVHDLWVHESYRGSDLAAELLSRAVRQAREDGCERLTLEVGTDNERARRFFDRLGFDTKGYRMCVPLEDLSLEPGSADPLLEDATSLTLRRLRAEEDVMHRFVEECWLPFWRDLDEAVGERRLRPGLDRDDLVAELLDSYDVPDRRCWVVLDEPADPTAGLAEVDADFAGWVNAGLEPTDRFLDPPERLFVGNLYVNSGYRGSGLADRLVGRAVQYAREEGCTELSLDVEVANERASAYYEKLGFEPLRQHMAAPLDSIDL